MTLPIKQGGVAAQQADAAVSAIAASLGVAIHRHYGRSFAGSC